MARRQRHLMRQITVADFPASWQADPLDPASPSADERSHDSRHDGKRFMLRLDDPTWEKLEEFSKHFDQSAAEIIRQLVHHTTLKDFPAAWQMAGGPRRTHPRRNASTRRRQP